MEDILGRPIADGDLEPDNVFYGEIGKSVSAADYLLAVTASSTCGAARCCRGGIPPTAAPVTTCC